jgi:hypothetical protein
MNVEKVLVKKTIRMGDGTMVMPGTVFPNPEYPEIPKDIRLEIGKYRGVVEVIKLQPAPAQKKPAEAVKRVSKASADSKPAEAPEGAAKEESTQDEPISASGEGAEPSPEPETEPAGGKKVPKPGTVTTKRTRKVITTK